MARHRLVVRLEQVLPLDFAIPMHVFAREAPEFYEVSTATIDGGPVGVAGGLHVVPDGDLRRLPSAETIAIPGWGGDAGPGSYVAAHLSSPLSGRLGTDAVRLAP
jgi:hypothetical protein